MFRKTKLRLVSLYTFVFFIILSVLGLSVYFYMDRKSYSTNDDRLLLKADSLIKNNGTPVPEETERESERRVSYLYWDKKGGIIKSDPPNVFSQKDLRNLMPKKTTEHLRTQSIDGHFYRILTINGNKINKLSMKKVTAIELVYNIDPEVTILKNLLEMIGLGSAGGLILSYFAGLFLASKSLVPIQKSWEKQSQFVADASHELRTPLSVIQTHLELLFRHPANTIEQESVTIYKSLSEVKRVNKLVEDLLTLARTDSNEQLIISQWFALDEMLQLIVEQFEPIAEMKEINIEERIERDLQYFGDKDRLHQLLVILVDNAIKYTASGGKVSIICMNAANLIQIIIKDTGVGIPERDLPHIFDRFYRSNKSRTRAEGGTGLGLSIAKWIVEAHHGHINVESKLNEGTKFTIKLP
ncbi:sensor histidine kinase [Neobacillus ginsengisoli]|uniref:histidine kinase n=1 Tax=Neobacillus ginsengisoli TaxID=904295 RepID=A0ABT9XSC3_9BACI|nr:HAMP domain-containing sensor histidine kinase [Neobacillus ginsengisoli]MDQ0197832.1 signal transduction histidine kinase [Neobacillus ginsengisoli]